MKERLVRRIVVDVVTSHATGAGTAAPVMLGLGGREFRLQVDADEDFERGAESNFQLGEDANVQHPSRNDPRLGVPIHVRDVLSHPVYVKLLAKADKDDWLVEGVTVRVIPQGERRAIRYAALEGPQQTAWLGLQSGTVLHLRRLSLERLKEVTE
jgi:hypothetical protein